MKKVFYILIISFLSISSTGCSNNTGIDDTPAMPLETDYWNVVLTDQKTTATIRILSGNGGYKVLQPKKIWLGMGEFENDKRMIDIHIVNDDMIVLTKTSNTDGKGSFVVATLLLMDSKDKKHTIHIVGPNVGGFGNGAYDKEIDRNFIEANYPDYWYTN